jgi:predicted metal-dependent HD superfamily phosphohydrolase
MFTELDKVESKIKHLDTLLFTIYYHDIIYKPTKRDNEHQSALIFEKRISQTSFTYLSDCKAQIEAIKEHKLTNDNDTNILLDLDLSILGKSAKEYEKYCENIRKEYQIYPDFMYRKGRKEFLKNILELDSIYKTDFFKQEYETQAKENLRNELNQLN